MTISKQRDQKLIDYSFLSDNCSTHAPLKIEDLVARTHWFSFVLRLPPRPRSRSRNLRIIQDEGRETRTRSYLPVPCDPEVSFSITWSRLKLAGFCRIGYSLKLSSHLATTA